MTMTKFYNSLGRICSVRRSSSELPVQPGLSLTPTAMLDRAMSGEPITSLLSDERAYDDGQRTPPGVPVLDRQRGVDIADLWENQQDIRYKMRKLHSIEKPADVSSSNT